MSLALILAAATAVLAQAPAEAPAPAAPPAAVATAERGVIAYPPSFFAGTSPTSAFDMVTRVPGFTFDRGQQVRGLAGSGGNVLIDGEPPVSKSDSLEDFLRRIPASAVARIDLIRGGAPGIDMQGKTVIANVVRKSQAGFRAALSPGVYLLYDGRSLWGLRGEASWRFSGNRAAEASFVVGQGPSDESGDGPRVRYGPTGAVLIRSTVDTDADGTRNWLTGAYETPLAGGRLRVNGAFMHTPTSAESTDRLAGAGKEYQYDTIITDQTELGARFTRKLTPRTALEAVAFQQFNNVDTISRFEATGLTRNFHLDKRARESVVRGVVRFHQSERVELEAGAEGAFNRLDSKTVFIQNGAPVVVPAANIIVEEKRHEVFGQGTWRPTDRLTLEAGVRREGSTITSAGDVTLEKTLTFTKPRFAAAWAPNGSNQFRVRLEREVGQLNFNDFVSNNSFLSTGGTLQSGNPDLTPQQAWVAEAAYERRFWKSAAVVMTLRHYEIDDAVDRVPVRNAAGVVVADAPGNIGSATQDEALVSVSLPLDRFGVRTGLLKAQALKRRSEVTDPVTGRAREISGLHPLEWEIRYSQDLPRWKANWGFDINRGPNGVSGYRETFYRLTEIETKKSETWVTVYGEYKPRRDLTLRLEAQALGGREVERIREVYAGPRSTAALAYTDVRNLNWGSSVYFRLRKTFGG